jgi:hypothetical protein
VSTLIDLNGSKKNELSPKMHRLVTSALMDQRRPAGSGARRPRRPGARVVMKVASGDGSAINQFVEASRIN